MALEGIGRHKIVSIEQLRQIHAADQQAAKGRTTRSATTEEQDPSASASTPVRPPAEERDRLIRELKAEVEELPDVRRDKVIEAKLRISTGYYNREEVRREILRSFLTSILPKDASGSSPAEPGGTAPAPDQPSA